jgi:hypothetical protein
VRGGWRQRGGARPRRNRNRRASVFACLRCSRRPRRTSGDACATNHIFVYWDHIRGPLRCTLKAVCLGSLAFSLLAASAVRRWLCRTGRRGPPAPWPPMRPKCVTSSSSRRRRWFRQPFLSPLFLSPFQVRRRRTPLRRRSLDSRALACRRRGIGGTSLAKRRRRRCCGSNRSNRSRNIPGVGLARAVTPRAPGIDVFWEASSTGACAAAIRLTDFSETDRIQFALSGKFGLFWAWIGIRGKSRNA